MGGNDNVCEWRGERPSFFLLPPTFARDREGATAKKTKQGKRVLSGWSAPKGLGVHQEEIGTTVMGIDLPSISCSSAYSF
ncbi:hypothetical protein KSP40_PGU021616 [Platanthera guangdongensis]|uniref:Uncharacterized protein n=1 Tax=Platanthera guangdongensis TaxID=2320717 RepID=A0ABR2MZA5_9ASPA